MTTTAVSAPRWYLVGVLPEEVPLAHLMTRSGDLRYRRSACGERESRSWKPVDLTTSEVAPCPACVATLPAPPAGVRVAPGGDDLGQLSLDLEI
ncbi:hypothetical protein SAMN05421837_101495 [Amycolatopsis pretoriensis]|uniref:Uncharacterized protein n=1 Tax=Amycolatopsis pretoriensis TaxID=218821 RepID=A0A1H5Q5L3_9PSEU|nr:hypothetical protein [Amycolatopsis pretoriensis]SEF20708.1 hypothetical protein SAMN05421837_101495 [Amycolatopsis pretoriensis]